MVGQIKRARTRREKVEHITPLSQSEGVNAATRVRKREQKSQQTREIHCACI